MKAKIFRIGLNTTELLVADLLLPPGLWRVEMLRSGLLVDRTYLSNEQKRNAKHHRLKARLSGRKVATELRIFSGVSKKIEDRRKME